MSKYDELKTEFQIYADDIRKFRERGQQVVAAALGGLAEFLEAPQGLTRFRQIDQAPGDETNFTPLRAATMADDGWWSGTLSVEVLYKTRIGFTVYAFVDTDHVKARIGDSTQEYRLPLEGAFAEKLLPLYEEAVSRSIQYMKTGKERFLDGVRPPSGDARPIGFIWGRDVPGNVQT